MKEKQNKIDRRNFLKTVGAAGLGSALAGMRPVAASAQVTAESSKPKGSGEAQESKTPQVPRRKLGKTGADVPCLSLGAAFNALENQSFLAKTLESGINYWDTSYVSAGGNSELGIGKFLSKNPKLRKKLFITTKASGAKNIAEIEERLQNSLKRMNTKYIDLYCGAYMLSDPAPLTDELKQWAESAKKRKLIRFFGFSTHSNMAQCLAAAPKLGWIDAIMTLYNFRVMQDAKMQAAVEACHKAGIGLIAMKTGGRRQKVETEEDKKLVKYFLQRGFTEAQAKIKLVMQDKRFSTVCVRMDNNTILASNIAVALDKIKLSQADVDVLRKYAAATCSGYCAGCAYICDSALPDDVPYVSDIMRYLMYHNSYGDKALARELFAQIPSKVRGKLLSIDYRAAEARCPQRMPIGKLVAEAVSKLA